MEIMQAAPETTSTPAAPETGAEPAKRGPKKGSKWKKRLLIAAAAAALVFWLVLRPMLGGAGAAAIGAYQPAPVQRQSLTVAVSAGVLLLGYYLLCRLLGCVTAKEEKLFRQALQG